MSTSAPDTRPLADLTDLEIATLTADLKTSQAALQPLISPLAPLASLASQYEGAPTYLSKIEQLRKDGWKETRGVRGDGNCFYRAFGFAYVERLLEADVAVAKRALDKIESLLPLLDRAGFAKDIYQDFYDPLQALLVSFASQRPTATTLLAAFNDAETSNSIVVFLRLLTSAYLRANEDDFTPFLFGLEDDPRFFEGGVPTLEMFCGFHVEAVDKEADHIQITALTRALKIHTRIAYLDQSDGETALHEFEEGSEDVLGCALLYRPGHYDCLYR